MVIHMEGSIFDTKAPVIVNPVNCVGIMGAGLAHEFHKREPRNYEKYKEACERKLLRPGGIFPFQSTKLILNAETKDHYKDKTNPLWIAPILGKIKRHYDWVALPYLGAGLGGLPEDFVRDLVEMTFADEPFIKVELWKYI